jgi:hypothetical protein
MNCYYPANHTVTKILTEPKISIAIGSDIINRMNRLYAHDDPTMLYYRATSQMYLTNTLIRVVTVPGQSESQPLKEDIEIVKDTLIPLRNNV